MLRPIDTQTIYQQSQEISNRQQTMKQGLEMQQSQFSNILQKETAQKQESVVEIKHDDQIKNNLKEKNGRNHSNEQRKYKNQDEKEKEDKEEKNDGTFHIDIRV